MKTTIRASLVIRTSALAAGFMLLSSCGYIEPLLPVPPTEPIGPVERVKDEPGRFLTTVELARISNEVYGDVPYFADTGAVWNPFGVDAVACNRTDQTPICKRLVQKDIGFGWGGIDVQSNGSASSKLRLEYIYTADNGLQAALYQQADANAFVLAFAGTKAANDVLVDLLLVAGAPPQPVMFQTIARDATARMNALARGSKHPRKLQITGHSLGGYHAQIMSTYITANSLETFNAPGSSMSRGLGRLGNTKASRVRHHVRRQDKVHLAGGSHFVKATYYFEANHHNLHGMGPFLEHLKTNPLEIGSVKHRNKVLMSFETAKTLVGKIPGLNKFIKGETKVCARGYVNPSNLKLDSGSCVAATTFNYTSTGFIVNRRSFELKQRCIQENGNGRPVTMEVCNGSRRQAWKPNGPRLSNVRTGRCLDMSKGGSAPGQLITYACHDGANQKWRFD